MKADLVLRGGTVVDGSGSPPFEADVVVTHDRITQIGHYDGPAREVLDARGKLVTPGFIDIHTHLDAQITWDPLAMPATLHGVTTVMVGNCGVGFAPCREQDRDYLMFLMEGVEDIPQSALQAGLQWTWESFPEYLDALAAHPLGPNIGAHISHAPLRIFVMGERGAGTETPTADERRQMRALVRDAVRAGAFGVDTGRTTMHRTPAWDPVPGTFADRDELAALFGGLADAGRGLFELIAYGGAGEDAQGTERELDWMVPMAREFKRPISLALIQNLAYPDVWRSVLHRVESAHQEGLPIVPQVAVRSVGVLMGFGCAISPLSLFPGAADLIEKPIDEQRRLLHDPAVRAQVLAGIEETSGDILGGMARIENVFALDGRGVLDYETGPDRSVAAVGRRQGRHPLEVVLDHIVATDTRGFFLIPLYNFDLEAAGEMVKHPLTNIGLGDCGAHTTQTSDAGFATFLLAYWVRQRRLLTLQDAVRKLTSAPAQLWGIRDRGTLRPGTFADLNVIDLDRLDLCGPELHHDLPGGAANLHQGAVGYCATIVNGEILMRDGSPTRLLPGRLLRSAS